ncbi:MAG: hypothetical protein JSW16_04305 [Dehalococcoidales bacterium]|nr:MAG: hypothetical protein JSW16_04305 [Dehalococcoidales bacterium]
MADLDNVKILVNPQITAGQLFSFYQRNNICEEGYGKELASKPLYHSSLIIGAFEGDKLVGITRAMFDGLSAVVMEFCLDLKYHGVNLEYENGSLIGKDDSGLGKRMGEVLINELSHMGADFISCDIFDEYESSFYRSLGFEPKSNHSAYYIDKRPYLGDERYMTRRRSKSTENAC